MQHPFLDTTYEIRWSQLTPEHVQPDISLALEKAQANLDAIRAQNPDEATFASAFLALEDATRVLGEAWSKVTHLDAVDNSPQLREAYNAMLPKVTEFYARIHLDEQLWQVIKAADSRIQEKDLTPTQNRLRQETLEDFREAGADLPPEKKERLMALQSELSRLTQKFSENDLDATNAYELVIDDESRLAGLPETARTAAHESAQKKGYGTDEKPAWRFTLHAPSFVPVLQYLDDEDIRKEMMMAYTHLCHGGEHDNTEIIWKVLELRQEKAELLGKPHFADIATSRRMVKSGQKALSFVEDMHDRIYDQFKEECAELEAYKAEKTGQPEEPLEPWETAYWMEKMRKEQYAFDSEALRPYFPIGNVINGMFRICERIFGLKISERTGEALPEVWHPEVQFFDIHDENGERLGSFYTDWHPRESKRSGAWMDEFITGRGGSHKPREPHLGLICGNLAAPSGGKPALLNHREVQTIFHEFGHLLHHLLGDIDIRSLNGIHVSWDFVELPSQILENWTWERESLDLFALHYETGEPIPQDLYEKMVAARHFMAARGIMRQLSLGKLDLEFHTRFEAYKGKDLDELTREMLKDYLAPVKTELPFLTRQFGHIFASPMGYAAGYYSYKWSEALDADAFTRFRSEGILNPETGRALRDTILSQGNSRPPDELFRDFMGRDPDPEALLRRDGLA